MRRGDLLVAVNFGERARRARSSRATSSLLFRTPVGPTLSDGRLDLPRTCRSSAGSRATIGA